VEWGACGGGAPVRARVGAGPCAGGPPSRPHHLPLPPHSGPAHPPGSRWLVTGHGDSGVQARGGEAGCRGAGTAATRIMELQDPRSCMITCRTQEMDREVGNGPNPTPPPQQLPIQYWAAGSRAWSCGRRRRWRPQGWRFPRIPFLQSNWGDSQAAGPSSQSSTMARNVTRDGLLDGQPAVASRRHSIGRLFTLLPLGGVVWQNPMHSSGRGSQGTTGGAAAFSKDWKGRDLTWRVML
jgi:hypothetical protein